MRDLEVAVHGGQVCWPQCRMGNRVLGMSRPNINIHAYIHGKSLQVPLRNALQLIRLAKCGFAKSLLNIIFTCSEIQDVLYLLSNLTAEKNAYLLEAC